MNKTGRDESRMKTGEAGGAPMKMQKLRFIRFPRRQEHHLKIGAENRINWIPT